MKNSLLRAASIAACVLALTAPIGAAQAETQSHKDPRGDVVSDQQGRAAARQPGIDIRKVVNTFEGDTLKMRVKVPNLARQYDARWNLKTDRGRYAAYVGGFRGSTGITFYTVRGDVSLDATPRADDASKVEVDCDGVGLKTRGNSIIVTIDRSCINNATHLRIATDTIRFTRTRYMTDDAWRKGIPRNGRDKYGPRLNLN